MKKKDGGDLGKILDTGADMAKTFSKQDLEITAKTTSLESIHKHNVISKGTTSTKK